MLKDELDLQRPILYSAGGAEIGDDWFYGHSWVLDGYNEDDEFYCNWGWYGESNGWYSLGFDPPGDKGPYNQIESAIFDVVPVQLTGVATPQLTSETFAYNPNGYTLSVPETFGATSYQWSTDQGSISGNGRTAILYSNCSANVSVRAYNNVCNIYSTYDTEQFNIKYEISGPSNLCSSGATYSVPNLPQGSYVSWSFSSNIQSYYGGNTWIALRAIGNGAGWVQATITNTNCGNITLPRMAVWAGIPTAYNFYTEVNGEEVEYYDVGLICPNTINCFDAESELDEMEVSDYTWHLPQGYTVWSGNGNGLCFDANGAVGSPIIGDVTNSCGTGYGVIQLYLGDNGCSRSYQYAISPNPTSTVLTVEQLTAEEAVGRSVLEPAEVYDLSDSKDADDGSYTVEIWHEKKGKVKSVESKSKKEMIDVSKLEKGYYILHIRTKQALYQEHILVK